MQCLYVKILNKWFKIYDLNIDLMVFFQFMIIVFDLSVVYCGSK